MSRVEILDDIEFELRQLACSYYAYESTLSTFRIISLENNFGTIEVGCRVAELGKVEQPIIFNISIKGG